MDLDDNREIVARLAKVDVNMPNYGGFPLEKLVAKVEFEVAVSPFLREEPMIKASVLIYHRSPVLLPNPSQLKPKNILRRKLQLYIRATGENNIWCELKHDNKVMVSGSVQRNC